MYDAREFKKYPENHGVYVEGTMDWQSCNCGSMEEVVAYKIWGRI